MQTHRFHLQRPTTGFYRLEFHGKAVRVWRGPWSSMVDNGSLVQHSLLLARCAEALDWSYIPVRTALFVRPLEVHGEPPEGFLGKWMEIPQDLFARCEDHFRSELQEVGARFRRGEAADLIFLAQLTPVS